MPITVTTRAGIHRWSSGADAFTRAQLDADHAALETNAAFFLPEGLYSAMPAASAAYDRFYYYATDARAIFWCDGTTWSPLGGIVSMTTAQRDALVAGGKWTGRQIWNSDATVPRHETYKGATLTWQPTSTADLATAAGDTFFASAAGVMSRIAAGAQSAIFRMGASSTPGWVALTIPWEAEWTIAAPGVPSGATNFIAPLRCNVPSGWTMDLRKAAYGIRAGTSVTSDVRKASSISGVTAGTTQTGFTSLSSTTSSIGTPTTPTAVALTDGDLIAPVPSAVAGSPDNWVIQLSGLYTFAG